MLFKISQNFFVQIFEKKKKKDCLESDGLDIKFNNK